MTINLCSIQRCKTNLTSAILFLLVLQCNLTTAQDFKIDSILLEKKTIATYDSTNISVVKKVFVQSSKISNYAIFAVEATEYIINSEYWLFWNNNLDSMKILTKTNHDLLNNFIISNRQIQNNINAIVLEYSEMIESTGFSQDSYRVFQILNLNSKSYLFYTRENEHSSMHNGGAHGDFRHDIDVYSSDYLLYFDDKDNITIRQTKNEVYRGNRAKVEQRKIRLDQYYLLTQKEDKLHYVISYEK